MVVRVNISQVQWRGVKVRFESWLIANCFFLSYKTIKEWNNGKSRNNKKYFIAPPKEKNMHSAIKKVKKDLEKGEKDVKSLMKKDVKADAKMAKMKKKAKGC